MVRPIVGLLLGVATRCNCDGIARGLSARSQAEEELLVRMLTLQHQQMAGDRPLDSLSAIVSEAHGGADAPTGTAGALVSPWAHELAASTVVPESIELRPRTACEFTFRGMWKEQADIEELLVLEAKVGKETLNAFLDEVELPALGDVRYETPDTACFFKCDAMEGRVMQ